MSPVVPLLGFSAILALAAIAVSFFAIWRTNALTNMVEQRTRSRTNQLQTTIATLQSAMDGHAGRLSDLEHQPPSGVAPPVPRAGLNLCKRSQALRMHRKGDPPERIAAALEIPQQEVDLLIKVHRIVLGHL
ncbi:MAG TPA: hypothetical protein VMB03_29145 [Bryobacteraceae bacterium]|nr:hypothetical protein [Bryobacteraceae bacterium]